MSKHQQQSEKKTEEKRPDKTIPTVGRIVWLYSRKMKNPEPLAAIVAKVIDEDHLNLGGFMESGRPFGDGFQNVPHVSLLADKTDEERHSLDFWTWSPYQMGHGTKDGERLTAELAEARSKLASANASKDDNADATSAASDPPGAGTEPGNLPDPTTPPVVPEVA